MHHFGPKKYDFFNHALAWLVKQECRLGYRRVTALLRGLGIKCPCASAIWTSLTKMPLALWQRLLACTSRQKFNLIALDGTGLSRPLPSPYYYRRIDKPYPVEIPLKLSIAVDTRTKKILAVRLRARKSHDIKDVKYLVRRLPSMPAKLLADKAYDAEWVHRYCHSLGIQAIIPMRDYGSKKIYRGKSLRKKAQLSFRIKTYHRREMVEAVFSAFKRKFGPSLSSVKLSAQRAEVYCRAIAHNLFFVTAGLFERCPYLSKSINISYT